MGRNAIRLLRFAITYPGWHRYGTDRSTVRAIKRLRDLNFIEVNDHRQFRLWLPKDSASILSAREDRDRAVGDIQQWPGAPSVG